MPDVSSRLELVDQPLERDILVGGPVQDGLSHVFEEVAEGRVRIDVRAQNERVDEEADQELVSRVIERGYAPDLNEDELESIGRDPFLVAYALVEQVGRCVVTTEASKPSSQRANRHLPDVARDLSVSCCDTFELLRALGFSTSWNP